MLTDRSSNGFSGPFIEILIDSMVNEVIVVFINLSLTRFSPLTSMTRLVMFTLSEKTDLQETLESDLKLKNNKKVEVMT